MFGLRQRHFGSKHSPTNLYRDLCATLAGLDQDPLNQMRFQHRTICIVAAPASQRDDSPTKRLWNDVFLSDDISQIGGSWNRIATNGTTELSSERRSEVLKVTGVPMEQFLES